MPVPTSNQGAESKRWLVPLLAVSTHQVLADSLLAVGPMQKSPATLAVVLDPRKLSTLAAALTCMRGFCFRPQAVTSDGSVVARAVLYR